MANLYLLGYNAALLGGWAYILYLTLITAVVEGKGTEDVWKAVEMPLKWSQTAAVLEIVHSAVGLVRSPVMVTALQVASREWLLWGIIVPVGKPVISGSLKLLSISGLTLQLNLTTLLIAWATSEIIRYGFFALKELGLSPYPALWLRYSGFIVLYPLGVSSELALVYLALPSIRASRMWSVDLPNRFNFAFDYYLACIAGMATYAPFFPVLFGHLLAQRKKNLRPKPKTE